MLESIEGNFDNQEVHELLIKHFIELRAASPKGSAHVLDIPGLKVFDLYSSISFPRIFIISAALEFFPTAIISRLHTALI